MWQDAISGRAIDAPTEPLVNGEIIYTGEAPITARRAPMRRGQTLLAEASGRLECPALGGVRIERATVPDADALRTLRAMGQSLSARAIGRPWATWLGQSPLMPPMNEVLEPTELEREAEANLGSVEEICRRPRARLTTQSERQLVSRCKRPSPRAAQVLSARSEDWARRTLFGVAPKRILGTVRQSSLDLYENRMTVGLIDRLNQALAERIRIVRRIVQTAKSVQTWSERLHHSRNYRRAERICRLWGELWSDDGLLARAESRLNALQALRRRVLALKDSPLYRELGPAPQRLSLRMSNIFTGDALYRIVADLWQVWELHVQTGAMPPEERWQREQEAAEGMRRFGALIVARALHDLGAAPINEQGQPGLAPGHPLDLDSPCGLIEWRWSKAGDRLTLRHVASDKYLEVVTLPAMLQRWQAPEAWLNRLKGESTLILHLAADDVKVQGLTRARLQGPGPTHRWPLLAPVAPWSLASVEVVARALRWFLWGAHLRAYPPTFPMPRSLETLRLPRWIVVQGDTATATDPPDPSQPLCEELDQWIAGHKRQLQELTEQFTRRKTDRRRAGPIQQQRQETQATLKQEQRLREDVEGAAQALNNLLTCPICRHNNERFSFHRVNGRYRVECSSCRGGWGLKDCRSCGKIFPYLAHKDPGEGDPFDVDDLYGCDVLAFPVSQGVFLCSHCGKPSGRKGG